MIEICGFQEDFPWENKLHIYKIFVKIRVFKIINFSNKIKYEYFFTLYSLNFILFCTITKQLPFCQFVGTPIVAIQFYIERKGKKKKKKIKKAKHQLLTNNEIVLEGFL